MKCALFSDTIFLKKNSDYYGMTITYDFLNKRYLQLFEQIIVSTRFRDIEKETGDYSGYKIVNGERVTVLPINNYKVIPDSLLNKKKIEKEIKVIVEKVDLVIIRLPGMIGNFACNICEKMKKPYIVELLACPLDGYWNHTNKIGKIIAPYMYYKTKKCVKKASKVIYVTNSFLQKRYPTKGKSIACSDVMLESVDNSILEKRIEKINKMDSSNISLCTVANVEMRYKGHEYVIKAISKINANPKSKLRYKYYVIGNGNQERLKNISKKYNVENDVIFLGSLSHKDVFKKLDEIDIYIQPSLQEGLPRAMVEAMSRGLPVFGTNCGGIPELINKESIFDKKNVKQIVKILENVDREQLINLAKINYKESKEYNSEFLDQKRIKIMEDFTNDK